MRRRFGVWAVIVAGTACLGCATSRPSDYVIPPGVAGENRRLLLERIRTGKALFKTNCSGCHGIFTKGKDGIPNFTTEQIDNYDANFVKADQRNHAVARKLSQEQVDKILTFLRSRRTETR
jgi:hypothetical protein